MDGQGWFLGLLLGWVVVWAVLERLAYDRQRRRDKYHDLNEGR